MIANFDDLEKTVATETETETETETGAVDTGAIIEQIRALENSVKTLADKIAALEKSENKNDKSPAENGGDTTKGDDVNGC